MGPAQERIEVRLAKIFSEGLDDTWDMCAAEQVTPDQIEDFMENGPKPEIFDSCIHFIFCYGLAVEQYACELAQRNPANLYRDIISEYWKIPILPKQAFKNLHN